MTLGGISLRMGYCITENILWFLFCLSALSFDVSLIQVPPDNPRITLRNTHIQETGGTRQAKNGGGGRGWSVQGHHKPYLERSSSDSLVGTANLHSHWDRSSTEKDLHPQKDCCNCIKWPSFSHNMVSSQNRYFQNMEPSCDPGSRSFCILPRHSTWCPWQSKPPILLHYIYSLLLGL